ncbi:Hypothetical predicted protein [Paramuricea clavata]|uniref:Uncharacterized protein n=2 Tax=Paramuricea clavata TaxID=317549 RepID=A0A7D9EAZ2_PARCT|nr:Hypothetical predicted protein [Paramuricea clavata]
MKSALVVLLIAQMIVVPGMTRNVAFNDYLAGRRCPAPACDDENNCYVVCYECQASRVFSDICRECQLCEKQGRRNGLIRL